MYYSIFFIILFIFIYKNNGNKRKINTVLFKLGWNIMYIYTLITDELKKYITIDKKNTIKIINLYLKKGELPINIYDVDHLVNYNNCITENSYIEITYNIENEIYTVYIYCKDDINYNFIENIENKKSRILSAEIDGNDITKELQKYEGPLNDFHYFLNNKINNELYKLEGDVLLIDENGDDYMFNINDSTMGGFINY